VVAKLLLGLLEVGCKPDILPNLIDLERNRETASNRVVHARHPHYVGRGSWDKEPRVP
jgi:hypothetical protein